MFCFVFFKIEAWISSKDILVSQDIYKIFAWTRKLTLLFLNVATEYAAFVQKGLPLPRLCLLSMLMKALEQREKCSS